MLKRKKGYHATNHKRNDPTSSGYCIFLSSTSNRQGWNALYETCHKCSDFSVSAWGKPNPEETVHLFARGLLHDVLKDTELTEEKLREIYPFPEVCDTVVILTRKKDEMYMNRTVRKGRLE